ncbi:MAG: protein-L-isoaspartate O-methyltransferase [Treponema sp.]|nr:protein-L-isoaspartate O-methyltransferase [Treponema sp.]MCL2271401.1 protein-L-isoaspartate O-methyltransferase [Treponema sp.]
MILDFFKKTIPAPLVFTVFFGVLIGTAFGLSIPHIFVTNFERVSTYEEVAASSMVEEALRFTGSSSLEEAGFSYVTLPGIQKYDGPRLAQSMPIGTKETWLSWMSRNRSDDPVFLDQRWDWAQDLVISSELKRPEDVRAFLLTPREHFVRAANKGLEYADTWLPIGYGATITDPDVVSMMTTTLNVQPGDKVLEIGTGSGYQAAILSYLTRDVYTIEIIRPLYVETDALYTELEKNFPSYSVINRKLGDGYYGWEEFAPFNKIIVTCSIDHIPPPLLRQLKPGGIMVLPLGPPNRQYIMEIVKHEAEDGSITLSRRDVYNGQSVKFIPFRDDAGASYSTPVPDEI